MRDPALEARHIVFIDPEVVKPSLSHDTGDRDGKALTRAFGEDGNLLLRLIAQEVAKDEFGDIVLFLRGLLTDWGHSTPDTEVARLLPVARIVEAVRVARLNRLGLGHAVRPVLVVDVLTGVSTAGSEGKAG